MLAEMVCQRCGKKFERNKSEVARNAKLNRKVYCSSRCSGTVSFSKITPESRVLRPENLRSNNRGDEYSVFRVFMHRAVKGQREYQKENYGSDENRKQVNVTLEYLKSLWERQAGICPYTGWQLKTPKNSGVKRFPTPDMASLDRIDSRKGYVMGNVQFISLMAQYGKNVYTSGQLLEFCEAVYKNHQKQPDALAERSSFS